MTLEERFWAKVSKTDSCWLWTAAKDKKGYGRIRNSEGKAERAHAVAYKMLVGPVPPGYEVDHKCHNKSCVRPDHLRAVTRKQNMENAKGPQRNNNSGYLGVSRHRPSGMWVAQITHHRKAMYLGLHDTPELANEAVVAKRLELYTHNDADRSTSAHAI